MGQSILEMDGNKLLMGRVLQKKVNSILSIPTTQKAMIAYIRLLIDKLELR
jgi:hypothetical protein